jgi:hypothetical protein
MDKQTEGCGVFVMVNEGNGKGRSAKDVVSVRSLFVDLDGAPWEQAADMLQPHIRVESSPGRFHLYWLIADCTLEQFKPLQQAIANKFNGDKSCVDLCRVLRLPGFYHLKKEPVLTKLIDVRPELPRYTIEEIYACLGIQPAINDAAPTTIEHEHRLVMSKTTKTNRVYEYTHPSSGEVLDLAIWAANNPDFDIIAALNQRYVVGGINDSKQHIRCPFEEEHADPGPDFATFVSNVSLPQFNSFVIRCMHNHCMHRDRLEFLLAMLNKGWLSPCIFIEPMKPLKQPKKVYLHVQEITASLEWTVLNKEELRIALHLSMLMWLEDGTLPDDDWLLARQLGVPETIWLEYRKTLTRTGWLLERNGRLSNHISKREFDSAQSALMKAVNSGRKGGQAKAALDHR